MMIRSCKRLVIKVQITVKNNIWVWRIVQTEKKMIIPSNSVLKISVSVCDEQLLNRDYIFEPTREEVYTHVVDSTVSFVCIQNCNSTSMWIGDCTCVEILTEYEEKECYSVKIEDHMLTFKYTSVKVDWTCSETKLKNEVTVYENAETVTVLSDVINKYPQIWEDSGHTVDISESDHMSISLMTDWNCFTALKLAHWVYSMRDAERQVIDKEFDKMHSQECMSWSSELSSFEFSVFIIWKTVFSGTEKVPIKKEWVVINIRDLNKIMITDIYLISLQSDILTAVQGSEYISIMNCTSFFHQWSVKSLDCHKFTVLSHWEAEQFNVAVMRYKNSPLYMQRKMNKLLWPFWAFTWDYIDDIVVFSKMLMKHLMHLKTIFNTFNEMRISIKEIKFFIDYLSATLLGQWVDAFRLSTAEEKITALKDLAFSKMLEDLEMYLSLTDWLWQYIPYYCQIVESLQHRKTALLRLSSAAEDLKRKVYISKTIITSTQTELEAFEQLQSKFTKLTFLIFFDWKWQLYMDIDSFKRYEVDIIIYHVKDDPIQSDFSWNDIQPILFLLKMLNSTE